MNAIRISQQNFLFQYISLVLIVLSILIAASDMTSNFPETIHQGKETTAISQPLFASNIEIRNLFLENDSINLDSLADIRELLLNHSLDLVLELPQSKSGVERLERLYQSLNSDLFWRRSVSVVLKSDPNIPENGALARFEWSQNEGL